MAAGRAHARPVAALPMPSRVSFPHLREAPEDILERLRAIDPTAELLWWGPRVADLQLAGGRNARTVQVVSPVWLLGTVRQNGARRLAGARLLAMQERLGARGDRDTWRYARLLYQGFATIAFYPTRDPGAEIVEDFRRRDWLLRFRADEEGERLLAEAEGAPQLEVRKQTAREFAEGEGPSIWRFAFKRPVSVTVN